MKNSNDDHKQDRFERKLNHLQGFIGLANWNLGHESHEEFKENKQQKETTRSKLSHSTIKKIKKWFIKFFHRSGNE